MISSNINLLPERALEALHKDERQRGRIYYLLAVVLSLLGLTAIMFIIAHFLGLSTQGSEQLLSDQETKLERLNDLWNRVIVMQDAVRYVGPARNKDEHLQEVWKAVTDNLKTLNLESLNWVNEGEYQINTIGSSPEESTAFLIGISESLPNASIKLENINQGDDIVHFAFKLTLTK